MGFQTPQNPLKDLISKIRRGRIQLPDFQRGYVWDDERIRSLLVTILQGHPLGVIMTLETGNENVRFKPSPIEGSGIAPDTVEPELLVLDGQQRLTSLCQALTGPVATVNANGKQVDRRYYLDLTRALNAPDDLDAAVRSLPADGKLKENFDRDVVLDVSTRENQIAEGLFPLSLTYADEGTDWLWDYPDSTAARTVLNTLIRPAQGYQIPSIQLDRSTSKAAVTTVFEKVNQGGMKLTVFELLTAKFAGDPDYFREYGRDFRLKSDWDETAAVIRHHPVLEGVGSTEFLQAVTLLASLRSDGATTARKEDVLDLELSDYLTWAPRVRGALPWVAAFLEDQHIHSGRDVPYPTQIVSLATVRVVLGEDMDVHGVRRRLAHWYWCGVLGELYSSSTETRFARDLEQVPEWARDLDGATAARPRTVEDANFVESRLLSLRTRNAAAYKGIYALLMAQDTRDWLFNQPFDRAHYRDLAVDIHHIFPKAWCLKNDIDPALRESIVNKTPLARKTNQAVGGVSPAVYMPRLYGRVGIPPEDLDAIVAAHQIDVAALRAGDFTTFFTHRREALLQLIETAMGKRAARDLDDDELLGGSEAPDLYAAEPDDPEDGVDEPDEAGPPRDARPPDYAGWHDGPAQPVTPASVTADRSNMGGN
ncbi:DUF262 domain-containing protein [Ruania zhangjianzhongii]|uniref:DUF262 domain-containing protein n=1 Tax=Ruania zhangjianzhongii TaxID=2603206 RepID=UPI0011CA0C6B|nr:DUF262 domain-containing protein [Ruania zhangjianzhongii]